MKQIFNKLLNTNMSRYETGIEKAEREEKERDEKQHFETRWVNILANSEREVRERFEQKQIHTRYETGIQKAVREEKERDEKHVMDIKWAFAHLSSSGF